MMAQNPTRLQGWPKSPLWITSLYRFQGLARIKVFPQSARAGVAEADDMTEQLCKVLYHQKIDASKWRDDNKNQIRVERCRWPVKSVTTVQVSNPVASPQKQNLTAVHECDGTTMSKHHSELIGCQLVNDETSWKEFYQRYERKICITHNFVVCRCGWELGFHFNSDSKSMFIKSKWRPRSEEVKARWRAWHKRRKALNQL